MIDTVKHLALCACALIASLMAATVHGAVDGYYTHPALHGDRLIFVSEGDLWTATLGGNEREPIIAHRLTSGDGREYQPRISADGRVIAYAADYEGNTDVYLMQIDGGAPQRLTFHPERDEPLAFTPDGRSILFRSSRDNPHGRPELWQVSVNGGTPENFAFGPCAQVAMDTTGKRIALTRWSNENWTWKRYRGGTAPDIWTGDLTTQSFKQITNNDANNLFPMWLTGRIYFLSDRDGTANIYSVRRDGTELKQHTSFAGDTGNPTQQLGYDARWPSADAQRGGSRIIFSHAGGLALLDVRKNEVTTLNVQLASDRVATLQRFDAPLEKATSMALSPDGKTLVLDTRGEVLSVPLEKGSPLQLTRSSFAREWGAGFVDDEFIALITDADGEQQIALQPIDGSDLPSLATSDREQWLFPPVASSDGQWLAFGDKTQRLSLLHRPSLNTMVIDSSDAWEITDYRFSPDSQWLAYVKPQPNEFGSMYLYSLRTRRTFHVSDGMHNDREPRWDPNGKYLYFLSSRHLNPILGDFDFEHIYTNTTQVMAVPLMDDTPPPVKTVAENAGFDLDEWVKPQDEDEEESEDAPDEPNNDNGVDEAETDFTMQIDTDGLTTRQYALEIEPGDYRHLEAIHGGVCYLTVPRNGLLDDDWPQTGMGTATKSLRKFLVSDEESKDLISDIAQYTISRDKSRIVAAKKDKLVYFSPDSAEEPEDIDMTEASLRINPRDEWRQIFEEAWRLQRDFYWAPNYIGVDWDAMREKYAALLPRIGNRDELNDLIGQMIGELGTSHTYVWGGEKDDSAKPVAVGTLGIDVVMEGGAHVIARIYKGMPWDENSAGPLAPAYLNIGEGDVIVAIDGQELSPQDNIYDLLQNRAGKHIRLTIADDVRGTNERTISIKTLSSDRKVRYLSWVEKNRQYVDEASEGKLGYLHIPDMGGDGLVAFSRMFYPQLDKKGIVIDIRDNGGGFVSQMIIQRLNRKIWAFMQPRHGTASRYPSRSMHAHMAVLIDQHAGSDGDIFPASFRLNEIGPLIGTRTWGGVVGIRADKPFVDFGISTQPEFAWWSPQDGWDVENRGVDPDIEVHIRPEDWIAGHDPQLDRAIEWLMNKLEEDPKELPAKPDWPVRATQ